MAKSGKPKRSKAAPQGRFAEGGRPKLPQEVVAEQIREAEESRRTRDADASQSVNKKHTGGR